MYQLIIRRVEPLGLGALQLALRKLQQRLAAEGLFAPECKKPLPRFPRHIAFVTRPTGAAVRDFLDVLRRRWRGVRVTVIPAKVQGEGAAMEIVRGIAAAHALTDMPDVLGRGYSVTQRSAIGEVVTDAGNLSIGDALTTRLARGSVSSRVTEIRVTEIAEDRSEPS